MQKSSKICTKCNQEKDLSFFSKNQYKCKLCYKKYREENKEKIHKQRHGIGIIKICKFCNFIGEDTNFYGKICKICRSAKRKKEYIPKRKRQKSSKKTKMCIHCGISRDSGIRFVGRFCTKCKNRINLEKKCIKKGVPVPSKRYSHTRNCIQCNFIGEKKHFHGKTCLTCYYKNRSDAYHNDERVNKIYKDSKKRQYLKNKESTEFILRNKVSVSIRKALKRENSSKNRKSCLNYLPYTIQELKQHLESLFEPWMNWNNHGKYSIQTWDDDDQSTWKWHVDHIIPQSCLPYTSMEDENFKKCWGLENLRPYSAKQNIIDGDRERIY